MRTENSIKNILISMLSQIILVLLGFVSRKVFIDSLGTEYLGINGLLTNILSMLSLVESGIGVSIVYNLYKPLAENDTETVTALVQLYKKLYCILALIVLGLSLMIYPIVIRVMGRNQEIFYVSVVYFIFVLKNIISYLYAHKWSLINADQKGYVLSGINIIFDIITLLIRIAILSVTKSYILYLVAEIFILLIKNIFNGRIVDKRYAYIKTKKRYKVSSEIKENIIKNVRALFLHNIGGYCVNGTDNLLIGAFISVGTVGVYSNYTLITGQLASLLSPILGGINASVGNLIALEGNEKRYSVFKVTFLVNFWVYSIMVIFLFNLLESFINWWIGEGYLLDRFTFCIILLNFYLTGMRISIATFKTKAGIFVQDKYVPLIEAAINLGASIILVKYLGLVGIFLGTTISTLSTVFWNVPRLVYKYVFNTSMKQYFIKYFMYMGIMFMTLWGVTWICQFWEGDHSFISLIGRGLVCMVIPNAVYILLFHKTSEFKYLWQSLCLQAKLVINKLKKRFAMEKVDHKMQIGE